MNHDRWNQIESIYNSARLMKPADRTMFLAEACAEDDELRQEVLALLASAESTDSFLDESALSLGLTVLSLEQPESLEGRNIGHYKIIRPLGCGGMGQVFLAHDARLNRHIAIKLLSFDVLTNPEWASLLEREARMASAISHPYVAHIYEIGEAESRHFIAMEYVSGNTLRETLKQGPIDIDRALEIAVQAAAALAAAHAAGVIHRDIKPENIMLRPDGYIKILDFGLAKSAYAGSPIPDIRMDEAQGLLIGTVAYMSPEQLRGEHVDAATDIWSLGVTLYEMISGRRPFEGSNTQQIIQAILNEAPVPVISDSSNAIAQVVTKALRKDRSHRYTSAQLLYEDLERLRQRAVQQKRLPQGDVVSDSQQRPTHNTDENDKLFLRTASQKISHCSLPSRRLFSDTQRRRVLLTGVALSVMAILLSVTVRQYQNNSSPPQSAASELKFLKLATKSKVLEAAISPSGREVAMIVEDGGKQGIMLRDLASSSDRDILPLSNERYRSLQFSHDGTRLFYLRQEESGSSTLFETSLGMVFPRKLLADVHTQIAFSPDARQIAFVRKKAESTALIVAKADASEERELLTLAGTTRFSVMRDLNNNLAWSPDGTVIVLSTVTQGDPFRMDIVEVRIEKPSIRVINSRPWYLIGQMAWLTDGRGLVMNAANTPDASLQLWRLSFPDGEATRITSDANSYDNVSLTSDGSTVLTTPRHQVSHVWLVGTKDNAVPARISSTQDKGLGGIAWTPDERLLYASEESGNLDLWSMKLDASSVTRLTFDERTDSAPDVSGDGRLIAFVSDRTGESHVWLMNNDGSQQKQLTFGKYEDSPQISPDGLWVVYHSELSGDDRIWRVPINGGEPARLTTMPAKHPRISPDGKLLACIFRENPSDPNWKLGVLSYPDGRILKTFRVPQVVSQQWQGIRWTNNNEAITYVVTQGGVSNIWYQTIRGNQPEPLTHFTEDQIPAFAWSRDGMQLACVRTTSLTDIVLIQAFR